MTGKFEALACDPPFVGARIPLPVGLASPGDISAVHDEHGARHEGRFV